MACSHQTKEGNPCRATALLADGNCLNHSATTEGALIRSKRARACSRKQYKYRSRIVDPEAAPLPYKTIEDVQQLVGESVNELRRGKITPPYLTAICSAAAYLLKIIDARQVANAKDLTEATKKARLSDSEAERIVEKILGGPYSSSNPGTLSDPLATSTDVPETTALSELVFS